MWPLLAFVRRHPWAVNVAAYGTLFSAADVAQQVLARPQWDLSEPEYLDLKQTGKTALVGFTFHANFNYIWFRSLERLLPGANAARVIVKVACDQAIAAPITIGAFYTGLSLLDGESEVLGNLREKFWPTYKAVNFTLVPPVLRTTYVGACSFLWTAFLCYLRQNDAQDTTARIFRTLPGLAGLFPSTANEKGVNLPSER
ncbi:UNVERIFIED_CONTAM: hypothetical protein K2H54_037510 [Gekko kuhli]